MVLGGLRMRLVRWGFVKKPFFVVTVCHARQARNSGNTFEDVGWWDPNTAGDGNMHAGFKIDRVKYWLAAGAQPTDKVLQLLSRSGIIPTPPKAPYSLKQDPGADTKWRPELKDK